MHINMVAIFCLVASTLMLFVGLLWSAVTPANLIIKISLVVCAAWGLLCMFFAGGVLHWV